VRIIVLHRRLRTKEEQALYPRPERRGFTARLINDPTRLLQHAISHQFIESMVVLNIATVVSIDVTSGAVPVNFGAGGIENMPFLVTNADTALVFATFWIEKIRHGLGHFMQLQ
jgi:hypothetical protein